MRIAIFDYQVIRRNPIGGCHLRMLRSLAGKHDFTVFAVEFENPCPARIKWVRIPAPLRPLPLLFVIYHLLAPLLYLRYRLQSGRPFDLIQTVESKLSFGDVAYSHFCHSSYLNMHWRTTQNSGVRGFSRWLDHRLHALLEPRIYKNVGHVIVPSKGLARELEAAFPVTAEKLQVLPNAVDVAGLQAPPEFARESFRRQHGFSASDIVFVFAALGHFERKGLPLLMDALSRCGSEQAKLLVVGGTRDLVDSYRRRAEAAGVDQRVVFAGMQDDVRPFFWAADAFVLASNYETFSLVAYEAAAAALPLITPLLHGIEEIVRDGVTGYIVARSVDEYAEALRRFIALPDQQRLEMGRQARRAALQYDEASFVDRWRQFYREWAQRAVSGQPSSARPSVSSSC